MSFNLDQPRFDLTADSIPVRNASWAALQLGEALIAEMRGQSGLAAYFAEAATCYAMNCYDAQTRSRTVHRGSYRNAAECVEMVLS